MEPSAEAMIAIPALMIKAWNRGDAPGNLADFAEDAVSLEIEGTIYRSRAEMTAAQQALFGTMLKGSRLVRGGLPFDRIVGPGAGVVHRRVSVLMPGEEEPPTRLSMQLFVAV